MAQEQDGTLLQRRSSLLSAATAFCNAFASQEDPSHILSSHFSAAHADDIIVEEHGLQQLAPFLGRQFRGKDGVRSYFDLIARCLTYSDMRFSNYFVDPVTNQVSVRGQATFTWTSTRQSWDEVFTYVLDFDEEFKVVKYEIWADSGAAYLASKGQL
ncbi:hypothetical protein QBC47DRAFT_390516 [Echria macrotheca]|uniref:Uncharacterized protein n=1 Tax=Echria macrotheca TaxID=438768 RepID=A0AAJ0F1T6_9PEZI|nr:hypothetical protein QBC47DRAFT_390516 [Echria macrotheca]